MKKKTVLETSVYMDDSSKREPIYTTERTGSKHKTLEVFLKENIDFPKITKQATGYFDFPKFVSVTIKPHAKNKDCENIAKKVRITIEII